LRACSELREFLAFLAGPDLLDRLDLLELLSVRPAARELLARPLVCREEFLADPARTTDALRPALRGAEWRRVDRFMANAMPFMSPNARKPMRIRRKTFACRPHGAWWSGR
jgi:hypothetical protein